MEIRKALVEQFKQEIEALRVSNIWVVLRQSEFMDMYYTGETLEVDGVDLPTFTENPRLCATYSLKDASEIAKKFYCEVIPKDLIL